ncbi:MAG TPA: cupin domain-containing protein [Terrimicrobiaceae bacterium]
MIAILVWRFSTLAAKNKAAWTAGDESVNRAMGDKSITKVSSATAPRGARGQKYLASGIRVSMRLWEEAATSPPKETTTADYETVGYVIAGTAELHLEGQMVLLEPGDSWIVPKGSFHSYSILKDFTAVEATSPPAEIHGRDEHGGATGT